MYNFTLYMTTDCNFKCQYCYEDYHNHYQLNEKTLVDSLEFMMNYGDRGKVLIDFLGGEPLLKKDLIYKAVAYIKDNYPEREVKYYITSHRRTTTSSLLPLILIPSLITTIINLSIVINNFKQFYI